jgi:hypothetical protein
LAYPLHFFSQSSSCLSPSLPFRSLQAPSSTSRAKSRVTMRGAAIQSPGLARAAPPAAVPLHPRPRRAGLGGHHHRHRGAPLRSDLLLLLQPTAVPCRARSPPSSSASSNVVSSIVRAPVVIPLVLNSDSGVWVSISCTRRTPRQGKMPTSCSRVCSRSMAKLCTAPAGAGLWPMRPTKTPSACHVCP